MQRLQPSLSCSLVDSVHPVRTVDPFWGQTTQISSSLFPKRDYGSKGVKEPVRQKRRNVFVRKGHFYPTSKYSWYTYSTRHLFLFFFSSLFIILALTSSIPTSTSNTGSHSGHSSPLPSHYGTCLDFYRDKKSAFSSMSVFNAGLQCGTCLP